MRSTKPIAVSLQTSWWPLCLYYLSSGLTFSALSASTNPFNFPKFMLTSYLHSLIPQFSPTCGATLLSECNSLFHHTQCISWLHSTNHHLVSPFISSYNVFQPLTFPELTILISSYYLSSPLLSLSLLSSFSVHSFPCFLGLPVASTRPLSVCFPSPLCHLSLP